MKKIVLLFLLFPAIVFAQGGNSLAVDKQGFTISAAVAGIPEGTAVKLTNANDKSELAKGTVQKGKFVLTGTVAEPTLGALAIGSEPQQYVYVENKAITITGAKEDIKNLKVSGSDSHADFLEFQKVFNPLFALMNTTVAELKKVPQGSPAFDKQMKKYDSLRNTVALEIKKFINSKPSSFISPFLLFVTAEMFTDEIMIMEGHYNKLSNNIKTSEIGKSLSSYINYYKVGAIGTAALDFTQPDVNGKPVSLSSFRGKYVLVDFWASWCGPCRAENPNLVENYKSFKDKNFTVLGVSLDKPEGKANWLAAIERDKLTWTQVSDLKFWNNEAAQLYRINSIPFNLLVDPTGKIIAKNLRGEELHSKLCEVLGCN